MGHRLRQFHHPRRQVLRARERDAQLALAEPNGLGQVAEAAAVHIGGYGDLDAAGGELAPGSLQFLDDAAPAGHFP